MAIKYAYGTRKIVNFAKNYKHIVLPISYVRMFNIQEGDCFDIFADSQGNLMMKLKRNYEIEKNKDGGE
ncbi:MAG: hypothetical protein ACP5RZ_05965 [Thermoplasmata archaeon]